VGNTLRSAVFAQLCDSAQLLLQLLWQTIAMGWLDKQQEGGE
jgi:hypothetical protein